MPGCSCPIGRVLKDEDALSTYKIQSSHTIHMVKGVARPAGTDPASAPPPQQLPTMQTGQNPSDPLTLLNGPMGHGLMAGFNPFAGAGVNTNDPNMMQNLMESPQFLQQMASMMSNPALVDQLIASDPNLAGMAPQLRMMFANPQFQQMVSNPESLRQMFQTAAQMRAGGFDPANMGMGGLYPPFPLGGGFGGGAGTSGASTGAAAGTATSPGVGGPTNLFNQAAQGGGVAGATGAAAPNPFAALLGGGAGLGAQSPGGVGNAAAGAGGGGANPFGMVDPNLMSQLLGGPGGFGGFGGAGSATAPPADSRPVEERFQVQLQQLNDMGFTNASQNVRALLATAGNVHAAIEYILGGNGL